MRLRNYEQRRTKRLQPLTLMLTPEQIQYLDKEGRKKNLSMAWIARAILDNVMRLDLENKKTEGGKNE